MELLQHQVIQHVRRTFPSDNIISRCIVLDPLFVQLDGDLPKAPSQLRDHLFNCVLVPLHHKSPGHWTLAQIDLGRSSVSWYDPLPASDRAQKVAKHLCSWLAPRSAPFTFYDMAGPRQHDGHNCGVFVLHAIHWRLRGLPLPSEFQLPRHFLSNLLVSNIPELDLSNAAPENPRSSFGRLQNRQSLENPDSSTILLDPAMTTRQLPRPTLPAPYECLTPEKLASKAMDVVVFGAEDHARLDGISRHPEQSLHTTTRKQRRWSDPKSLQVERVSLADSVSSALTEVAGLRDKVRSLRDSLRRHTEWQPRDSLSSLSSSLQQEEEHLERLEKEFSHVDSQVQDARRYQALRQWLTPILDTTPPPRGAVNGATTKNLRTFGASSPGWLRRC
ncbi:hypothetical protein NM208_g5731 [Fusarium decemcellulare]|uniref:Uncharacterized protein n=1 Tax=Fusarium decemcellulare TaxID=57161 RepID=A0ACC1SFR0_9HYPO|nr:hypothetical protein NM208_g5731 [Fusarium decemcellulare]